MEEDQKRVDGIRDQYSRQLPGDISLCLEQVGEDILALPQRDERAALLEDLAQAYHNASRLKGCEETNSYHILMGQIRDLSCQVEDLGVVTGEVGGYE